MAQADSKGQGAEGTTTMAPGTCTLSCAYSDEHPTLAL